MSSIFLHLQCDAKPEKSPQTKLSSSLESVFSSLQTHNFLNGGTFAFYNWSLILQRKGRYTNIQQEALNVWASTAKVKDHHLAKKE